MVTMDYRMMKIKRTKIKRTSEGYRTCLLALRRMCASSSLIFYNLYFGSVRFTHTLLLLSIGTVRHSTVHRYRGGISSLFFPAA